MIVAKVVAVFPTWTDRLFGKIDASRLTLPRLLATKSAVTVVLAPSVTTQGGTPAQPPPLQPAKVEFAAATAEITICVPV